MPLVEAALTVLGLIVVVAALAHALAHRLGAPPLAAFLVAGLAVRPLLAGGGDTLADLLLVSVAFLLFAGGAEVFPEPLRRRSLAPAVVVGVAGPALVAAAGFGVARVAGWGPLQATYAGLAAGASSTLAALSLVALREETKHPHARLVLHALVLQDLVLVVLLALLPHGDEPAGEPLRALGGLVLLVGAVVLAGMVARRPGAWRLARDDESRVLVVFALALGAMLVAGLVGVPSPAAAFLAGLALAGYPADVHARVAVRAASDFFRPVFFVTLAALMPLPGARHLPVLLALLALALLAKPLCVALAARAAGFSSRASAAAGTLAMGGSELVIVLVVLGMGGGALSAGESGVLWIAIAGSLFAASLLPSGLAWSLARSLPAETAPEPLAPREHVVVLGAGRGGRAALEALERRGVPTVAVDVDPHALEALPETVRTVRGDAEDRRILEAAGAREARAVLAFLKSDRATVETFRALGPTAREGQPRAARVDSEPAAQALAAMGVEPVRRDAIVEDAVRRLRA